MRGRFLSWDRPLVIRRSGGRRAVGEEWRCDLYRRRSEECRAQPADIRPAPEFTSRIEGSQLATRLEVLSEQKQQFDVIFNDIDKEGLSAGAAHWCFGAVAQGRLIYYRQRAVERKSCSEESKGRPPRKQFLNSTVSWYNLARFYLRRFCRFEMGWLWRGKNSCSGRLP